jgi:hypothetical protein
MTLAFVDVTTSETEDIPEYFVNGIAKIEEVCGNLRFTFFTYCSINEKSREVPRREKVAIIMPTAAVARSAMQAIAAAEETSTELMH